MGACCSRHCWSSIQLFCLLHRNFITRGILFFFYAWDAIRFAVGNPPKVTRARIAASRSKNVGALGKLLVADFQDVKRILQEPQCRGEFLGHFAVLASRLPPSFLLFLKDPFTPEEEAQNIHKLLREYIFHNVILAAHRRITVDKAEEFRAYLTEFLEEYRANGSPTDSFSSVSGALNAMVIKYVFHALFGAPLGADDLATVTDLIFGLSGSYPLSIVYGLGWFFRTKKLQENLARVVQLVEDSPAMAAYEPSAANGHLPKTEVAQVLFNIAGLAGMIGTKAICIQVLSRIPRDYDLQDNNDDAVLRAIVEAARLGAPVGEFHVLLPHEETFQVHGKPLKFPKGTPVCVSIAGATFDTDEFPNPDVFDPSRPNLLESCLNFNAPGLCPGSSSGMRECLGRDIFLRLCSDLLVLQRSGAAAAASSESTPLLK